MTSGTRPLRAFRQFAGALASASPRLTAATVALTVAASLSEGVGLLLLVPLLQLIGLDAGTGTVGPLMDWLTSGFATVGLRPTLLPVLLLYVAVIVLQSELQRRQTVVSTALRMTLVQNLRDRIYRAIANASWLYFSRRRASSFLQILTERIDRVAATAYFLVEFLVTGAIVLVYLAMALRVSPMLTGAITIGGLGLALMFHRRTGRARAIGRQDADAGERLYTTISDFLSSMKIAKGYGAERRHVSEFIAVSRQAVAASFAAVRATARTRQWLTIGSAVVLAALVYVAHTVMALDAASLFLLMFLFARLVPRVTSLYERAYAMALELPQFEIVMAEEQHALAAAEPAPTSSRALPLLRSIDIRGVSFRYTDDAAAVLKGVQLSFAARATTAIVGPSGAGKSTIADLLMGLVSPSSGVITVDDVPLAPEYLESWRSQIGYVPQDTLLFHDTVLANLRWAQPDATEADVWQALKMAAAEDFVRAMPKGLDTVLGDRGVLISGGERQRLSLARALLRRPRLLILDEATSSLDSENERRIQTAIDGLHEQMTIIVITHRLAMVRGADMIHVLDAGHGVESGSWASLVAARGRFHALCEAQGINDEPSRETADVPTLARH